MNANFIYSDLNPCGGGERLTLVTMEAVLEMGIDIELTTLKSPDITKITNAFGKDLAAVIKKIKKVNLLQHILDKQSNGDFAENRYDITINTHGDIDPYHDDSFSKNNSITYCHYPSAKYFMESDNLAYLEKHIKTAKEASLSENFICTSNLQIYGSQNVINFDRKRYLECLRHTYDRMIRNSTIITNSEYSRKAIFEAYGISDSIVISPPVDVDNFHKSLIISSPSTNDKKDDYILVNL